MMDATIGTKCPQCRGAECVDYWEYDIEEGAYDVLRGCHHCGWSENDYTLRNKTGEIYGWKPEVKRLNSIPHRSAKLDSRWRFHHSEVRISTFSIQVIISRAANLDG